MNYDVAILGGGPAGSTTGAFLKKYNPDLEVGIFEREVFPRDHVGESQLPPVCKILDEMGCWDKVEAANFPVKIGATYKWGKSPELWDFEFIPKGMTIDQARPARFEGLRRYTAFQVDRSVYDEILLDHAAEFGCQVHEGSKVMSIERKGDQVTGIALENGESVQARYYVDGTGHSGLLRRAMGIPASTPTSLQNIAIWDYFQNADWAVEIGVGGTRVQIMSLSYGWIWFIPLGPTRTSVGLVVPAQYYKQSGLTPEQLYKRALDEEDRIKSLMKSATSEGKLQTTKDWSFLAERHVGENWFLVGESAGFADPILSAGLTLTQQSAREAAFTILELDRGKEDAQWLKSQFERRQTQRVRNHIRFADYWYTANAQFRDLKEFTAKLAADNGLDYTPESAWAWLAQGGFIDDDAVFGTAGIEVNQLKDMRQFMLDMEPTDANVKNNVFELDLAGATWSNRALYVLGTVRKDGCYVRGNRLLPLVGPVDVLVQVLQKETKMPGISAMLNQIAERHKGDKMYFEEVMQRLGVAMEAMIADGWVKASYDPSLPVPIDPRRESGISKNVDPRR